MAKRRQPARELSEEPGAPAPPAYRVELTKAAERALAAMPRADLVRLDAKIAVLAHDPRPPGHTKLEGGSELYRIRSGDYRALYQIEDDRLRVLVVTAGHRRDVYRRKP